MYDVTMADGSIYTVKTLLGKGDSNTKLAKSDKAGRGYLTVGLSLAPADTSGHEVCASRSAGCTAACIFTAGMGVYKNVQAARIAKTRFFFQERGAFLDMLVKELSDANKRAKRKQMKLACRLNVFSDIPWEKLFPELFVKFPDVQFYDYTKHAKRMAAFDLSRVHNDATFFPLNYHLTFSRSESNIKECSAIVTYKYANITVVFSGGLPKNYMGRKVIDGDKTDLRFLDKKGVIVGLKVKGRGKKDASGFVVSVG